MRVIIVKLTAQLWIVVDSSTERVMYVVLRVVCLNVVNRCTSTRHTSFETKWMNCAQRTFQIGLQSNYLFIIRTKTTFKMLFHRYILFLVSFLAVSLLQASVPVAEPTLEPTVGPTLEPSAQPTVVPTAEPTAEPSAEPSVEPSAIPSRNPSLQPTQAPTKTPTSKPTTAVPTVKPTTRPTTAPSLVPTANPTSEPSPDDPNLLSYYLDCGVGKLVLNFDTAVSAKNANINGLSLQAMRHLQPTGVNSTLFRLSSSFNNLALQGNTTVLTVYMSTDDIARLNLAAPVGRSLATTFLALERDFIFSPTGKSATAIGTSDAMAPATLVQDIFPPYLLSFSLIMDTGLITITFSEPIDVSTFTLEGLTIQCCAYLGDGTNDPVKEQLTRNLNTQGSQLVSVSNLDRTIVYQLGTFNLNQIKAKVGLASSIDTTYLSAWKPFVNDTSGTSLMFLF